MSRIKELLKITDEEVKKVFTALVLKFWTVIDTFYICKFNMFLL